MKGYADRLKELPSGTNDIGIEVELGKPICQPLMRMNLSADLIFI